MAIYLLANNYFNNPLTQYYALIDKHDKIWARLYNGYPGILLEEEYSNSEAVNSISLYRSAINYLKDMREPERAYNISVINNAALQGYEGQYLDISMPIKIETSDYYKEADDVYQAIDQYLFITDISYNLRKDNDISITVNAIKQQDKLIQSLAKLIR